MSRQVEVVFAHRYSRLVHIAYLLLASERNRPTRIAHAHQLVQSVLPWRNGEAPEGKPDADEVFQWLLARIVRRVMRPRWWHRRAGGINMCWMRPRLDVGDDAHVAIDRALAGASVGVRVAFALLTLDGGIAGADGEPRPLFEQPTRQQVDAWARKMLAGVGIASGAETVVRARKLQRQLVEEEALDEDAQRVLINEPALNPNQVQLGVPNVGRQRGMRATRFFAATVALLLLVAVVGVISFESHSAEVKAVKAATPATTHTNVHPSIETVDADTWSHTDEHTFAVWPSRGELVADHALAQRALGVWQRKASADEQPDASVQLIYEGLVDSKAVVVLADRNHLARYTAAGDTVSVQPEVAIGAVPTTEQFARSALVLSSSPSGTRYLLAPWVTKAEAGDLNAAWRPLAAKSGVTDPVPSAAGAGSADCWKGPIIRIDAPTMRLGQDVTLAALSSGPTMTHLMHASHDPPKNAVRPNEFDQAGGAADWSRLGCQATQTGLKAPQTLVVWQFWKGTLPETNAPATWVCMRGETADGHDHEAAYLLTSDGVHKTSAGDQTSNCNRHGEAIVTTTAWKAPSGQWYVLAAASRHVRSMQVSGVAGKMQQNGSTTIVGPLSKRPSSAPVVHAVDDTGVQASTMH